MGFDMGTPLVEGSGSGIAYRRGPLARCVTSPHEGRPDEVEAQVEPHEAQQAKKKRLQMRELLQVFLKMVLFVLYRKVEMQV